MGKNKKKGQKAEPEVEVSQNLSGLLDNLNVGSDDEDNQKQTVDETSNKSNKKNGKKQQKGKNIEPEEEELPEAVSSKKGNKKNIKKKRNKWANSDSEEEEEAVVEPSPTAPAPKGGKKNGKKNKKKQIVESDEEIDKQQDEPGEDDDEEEIKPKKKGGFAALVDSEDEDEEEEEEVEVPVPVNTKKNNKKNAKKQAKMEKKNKKQQVVESEEEEEVQPKKKGGFAALVDSEDEDEEEEEEVEVPVPVNTKKNNKKNAKKQAKMEKKNKKQQVVESEEEEEEEEEVQPKKKGEFAALVDSEDEEEDEDKMEEDEVEKEIEPEVTSAPMEEEKDEQEDDDEEEEVVEKKSAKKNKKDKKSSELSFELKKEFKQLKTKKESGSLSKSEKARYKELKSMKKGGGDDEEVESPSKQKSSSSSKVYGGISDGKPVWPPVKVEGTAAAPWPPVAPPTTVSEPAATEVASTEKTNEDTSTKKTKPKATKMSKLQMKMEAAKQKREAEAAEKEAARLVEEEKQKAQAASLADGGGGGGEKPKKSVEKQDDTKRVFNVEDDLVRDASVPCSAILDTDIPEIDESKLTKKELKKAQRDRDNLIKLKEAEQERVKRSLEGAQFSCSQTAFDERDPVWLNSLDISIPSITISAYNKNLFVDAPLSITHGRHYGLVGPNGKGKSTLLKMIASGSLKIPPRIDALYVEQEVHADETPAFEAVLMADKVRWALIKEERAILGETAIKPDEEKDARLAVIYEELSAIDAAAAEPKARRILFGLGFDSEMQNRPTREFSGGWRMRISLARALFIEPTFLMLDEPTNHLDLNAVIWLDDYLQKWKKTLLIVSHDQDFLNSVCEEILHLNNQKLDTYRGNYDTFKQLEVKKREQANKAWELEQRRIKQLKASGVTKAKANEQVKNKKSKEQGSDKKKKNAAVASGTDSAEVKELLVRPREYAVTLQFGEVQKLQPPVIQVMEATFRYGPNLPIIFDELNFGIDMDSRICVVGNNGSGKSTLIKMLVGEVEPTTGYIRRNPKLRVGIYNQHFVDKLPMASSPVEYLRNSFQGLDYQSARNLLGKFGLEGHAHEIAMRDLSGGQKARVTFCELTLAKPHVLFLDEPTNNLDIESIDALCEAINAYKGGMVVVTHDARLIEATESELWVVEDRKVIAWDGEFDSYRDHLLKKLEQQMEEM